MNLQKLAKIIGIIFIIVGIIGFIPFIVMNGNLFGIFAASPMHNICYLVTGILGVLAASQEKYSKIFFQVFGIIFAILTIIGFFSLGNLFIMRVNMADNFLHLIIAIIFLYLGFFFKKTGPTQNIVK